MGGGEKSADAPVGLFAPLPSWVAPCAQRWFSSPVRVDPVQNRLPHHWVFWHQSQDRFGGRPPASAQPPGAAGGGQNGGGTGLLDAASSAAESTVPSSAHPKRTVGIGPKDEWAFDLQMSRSRRESTRSFHNIRSRLIAA